MEQGYERIEVVGRGQKNSAVDTKRAVRNRVSLRSIMFGSPQDQIKSEQQTQETERLALLELWLPSLPTKLATPSPKSSCL
jgi:DNA-binding protein